ncbi:hypothetical protein JTE90_026881 [Oedothorax gibbosus]|uniref:Uncharacterized protein n=1 Tax=Oedothorax gibbosus TaxID=931172 RepID=A0AAV6TSI5_9ARAC|nr:hypothetical protein JTE90_026881 [Oedothorax gibbosus]
MAVNRLIDLFPQNLSNRLFPIYTMQDWDPRISLHEWMQLNPEAYVAYIPPGDARVFFVSVAVKDTHLTRLLTSARSPATVLPDRLISFEKVGARLLKDPNNARRKSSVKTIYRCDHNIQSADMNMGRRDACEKKRHLENDSRVLYMERVLFSSAPISVFR